jgi:hypothetical protein
MAAGVLVGLLSSAVGWVIFVMLSHPRLRWSRVVAEWRASGRPGVVYQVKLMNLMPWSCVSVTVEAFLVIMGSDHRRIIVRVPIREAYFPVIGGSLGRNFRRRKYGWLGSSHRVMTLYFTGLSEVDLARMRRDDAAVVARCKEGDLGRLLECGAELLVTATSADGLFLGQSRRTIAVFRRREDVAAGVFACGRSVSLEQALEHAATSASGT